MVGEVGSYAALGVLDEDPCPAGYFAPCGSVIAMTMANAAPSAPLENHLLPVTMESSPSFAAVVLIQVGLEPGFSGSVNEKQLPTSPANSGKHLL